MEGYEVVDFELNNSEPITSRKRKKDQEESSNGPPKRPRAIRKRRSSSQLESSQSPKQYRQPSRFTIPVLSFRKHASEVSNSTLSALATKLSAKPGQKSIDLPCQPTPAQAKPTRRRRRPNQKKPVQPKPAQDTEPAKLEPASSVSAVIHSASQVLYQSPSPVKRLWINSKKSSPQKRRVKQGTGECEIGFILSPSIALLHMLISP